VGGGGEIKTFYRTVHGFDKGRGATLQLSTGSSVKSEEVRGQTGGREKGGGAKRARKGSHVLAWGNGQGEKGYRINHSNTSTQEGDNKNMGNRGRLHQTKTSWFQNELQRMVMGERKPSCDVWLGRENIALRRD